MTASENSGSQMVSGEEAALSRVLFLTSVDRRGRLILYGVTRDLHKLTSEKKKKVKSSSFLTVQWWEWMCTQLATHGLHTCT